MKIFIDIDNVIRDIDTAVFGRRQRHWRIEVAGLTFMEYVERNIDKILPNAPECEYCVPLRGWLDLFGSGDLCFLSSQPDLWLPYTEQWLAERFPNVPKMFVKQAEDKLPIIEKENAILIDDYPSFSSYERIVLIDRPYNKQVEAPRRICNELEFLFVLLRERFNSKTTEEENG